MTIQIDRGVFQRFDPTAPPLPIVVDVSRSGREYPETFRSMVPFTTLHDNVSMYVDEIWSATAALGGTMLYASFPSFWIDVNRDELDIDPDLIDGAWPVPLKPAISKLGLGLLKTKSRYGEPVHERKLQVHEVMERLHGYYRPYHAELSRIIRDLKSSAGFVYHLSCHCMSAIGAPTHPDPGQERKDFCIGNINGRTCSPATLDFVASVIEGLGYSCSINFPYAGAELNARHGDPAGGVESIFIEINKKLFMDTGTFRKTEGFHKVKADATHLLQQLAAKAQGRLGKGQ